MGQGMLRSTQPVPTPMVVPHCVQFAETCLSQWLADTSLASLTVVPPAADATVKASVVAAMSTYSQLVNRDMDTARPAGIHAPVCHTQNDVSDI